MSWPDLLLKVLNDQRLYRRVLVLLIPAMLVLLPAAVLVLAFL